MFKKQKDFNGQVIKEQYYDIDKKVWWIITYDKSTNKNVLYKNDKQVATGSVPELNKIMYK